MNRKEGDFVSQKTKESPDMKDIVSAEEIRRRFNMDETNVTASNKLATLFRIVAILTAITHKMGIMIDEIHPIKLKSHKRKAISYIQLAIRFIFRIINTSFNFPSYLKPIIPLYFVSSPTSSCNHTFNSYIAR